jgi:thioesterase domain-containing protein
MAEAYLSEIYEVQREGPYCLGGYCLGGTIAFEIAQRLRRDGHEVALLALLDTYNFSRMEESKPLGMIGQKLRFHLSNLLHMRLTNWPAYFTHKLQVARDGEFSSLWKRLRGSIRKNGEKRSQPSVEASLLEVNDRAASAYRPSPYGGRVTVFKPRVNYDFLPDSDMGWSEVVTGELDIVELPVSPHGMLVEPYVQALAVEIRRRLDGSCGEGKTGSGARAGDKTAARSGE